MTPRRLIPIGILIGVAAFAAAFFIGRATAGSSDDAGTKSSASTATVQVVNAPAPKVRAPTTAGGQVPGMVEPPPPPPPPPPTVSPTPPPVTPPSPPPVTPPSPPPPTPPPPTPPPPPPTIIG